MTDAVAAGAADYDVAVIGAGINGAGIARDAALRGLKVIVFDKGDMCSATSAISSRLIHGGLRYLEYGEIPLVYESLRERRRLRRIAPHLVAPLRISIPIYRGARRGRWLVRLGMLAYDLLSIGKSLPRHDMPSAATLRREEPGLLADGLRGAARYYDAQVSFSERLVLENLLAARAAGATVRTYCEVVGFDIDGGRVAAVDFVSADGQRGSARVRCVVNAAGPWVDEVLATAPEPAPRLIGGTKGSHIVVPAFAGAPRDAFYVEAASDGRPFFIIPWNDQYLIGTTDLRYDGDLDHVRASRAEVDYLLAETNRVFPRAALTLETIHYAYAGVRPLPFRERGPESAITRRHIIRVNAAIADNLVSIIGGKLTTYRNLAEQCVDRIGRILGRRLPPCRTRDTRLPGAAPADTASAALERLGVLTSAGIARLMGVYGARAGGIAALASEESTLVDEDLLAAEIRFCCREEFAATLVDILFRRTMLGLQAGQGRAAYDGIAAIAAEELDWDTARRDDELASLRRYADSLLVT